VRAFALGAALTLATPVALAAAITGPSEISGAASALAQREIPADLLTVYQGAALTCPGLPWQVLAAIGWVESRHAGGRADPATGSVSPPITGPAIDGRPGFARIPDPTQRDGWAHALGPMQFLSTTWASWGTVAPDRPPGAAPDVQNAWDSIYSAAAKLCGGQPRLSNLRAAILAYNRSESYYREVMSKAEVYGLGGPSAADGTTFAGSVEGVVRAAMTQLGVPYVWGAESPGQGFDCSGLVQWAFARIGVAVPRTTSQQILVGTPVGIEDLRPGDLIFTRGGRTVRDLGHVAIYAGGGMEIVAPRTGDVVSLRPVRRGSVQAIRRVLRS
jgi:cell wall-associated NlpC family hydrolase